MRRRTFLSNLVKICVAAGSPRLAVFRMTGYRGTVSYTLTEAQDLESIIAKHRGSLYFPGKEIKG